MSKYDEFDLDAQTISGNDNVEPASSGNVCVFTIVVCIPALTMMSCANSECCGTGAACGGTNKGCSGDTNSACRSYCGSGCR